MRKHLRPSARISVVVCWLVGLALPATALDLSQVDDWLDVLQLSAGADVTAIAATDFDLVVIDYSSDGSEDGELTPAQVAGLRTSGKGKIALAYLSIGEAESYRWYFDPTWIDGGESDPDAPAWLGPTNPEWEGNYKTRYWDAAWQAIVLAYLDRIVDQGFDGVYLDIIDAFQYWSEQAVPTERTRAQARLDMIALVEAIAEHARVDRGKPGFLVFPQNALDVALDDDEMLDATGQAYLATIDGVGLEDVFYDELVSQVPADTTYRLGVLQHYLAAGVLPLSVDYVWNDANPTGAANVSRYDDYVAQAQAQGMVPYAALADRALDEILEVPVSPFAVPQPRDNGIFADGFEAGSLIAWSASVGGP